MTEQEIESLYLGIGQRIKELRQHKGLNQEALAKDLNLTRASIANIEKGRQRVSIHLIYDICRITNANISEILLPDMGKDEELLPRLMKIIKESPEGTNLHDQKLTDFLINITSKQDQ
jgi:transcriptional regulator with XRE-family HTH domain